MKPLDMLPPTTQSQPLNPIATTAQKARELLRYRAQTKDDELDHFAESQFSRFNLWASNIGVFAALHASLDYRLRTANAARAAVEGNLEILCEQLFFALTGQEELGEELGEELQSFVKTSPQHVFQFGSDLHKRWIPDLHIHRPGLYGAEKTITILHQLSLAIRTASNRNTLTKATKLTEIDKEFSWVKERREGATEIDRQEVPPIWYDATQNFEAYVREVLDRRWMKHWPKKDIPKKEKDEMEMSTDLSVSQREYRQIIFDRCVSSITTRRRQLQYFQRHQAKLAADLTVIQPQKPTPSTAAPKPGNRLLPPGISRSSPALFTRPIDFNLPMLQAAPSETIGSEFQDVPLALLSSPINVAPSTAASSAYDVGIGPTRILGIAPPPKLLGSEKEKACPYCCLVYPAQIFNPERTSKWRKHMMEDVQPYPCLFKNCDRPTKTYQTFKQWHAHMNQPHYHDWHCPLFHPENQKNVEAVFRFDTLSGFEEHLAGYHSDLDESATRNIVLAAGRPTVLPEWCFICLEAQMGGVTKLLKHIEKHLRQAFLLALPARDDIKDTDDVSSGQSESDLEPDYIESFSDSDSAQLSTKKRSPSKNQEKTENDEEMAKTFEVAISVIKSSSGPKEVQLQRFFDSLAAAQLNPYTHTDLNTTQTFPRLSKKWHTLLIVISFLTSELRYVRLSRQQLKPHPPIRRNAFWVS